MSDRVLPFSTAAQAYGASRPLMVRAVPEGRAQAGQPLSSGRAGQAAQPAEPDTFDFSAAARARSTPAHPLAAAKVPGQVSFEGSTPAAGSPAPPPARDSRAMPIYANPASRNGAATGVDAGRLIDFEA